MTGIGWFCTYTPIEIICAAGLSPVRIMGHADSIKRADAHLHANLCPYVRSCLDRALAGEYDHLKGFVFINSCDAMRRLYDVWKDHAGNKFFFLLDLPKRRTDLDCTYFAGRLREWIHAMERHFSLRIEDGAIVKAVEIYQNSRRLYERLRELRKEFPSKITGTEFVRMAEQFFVGTPHAWNEMVEAFLNQRKEPKAIRPRVLVSGSPIHNAELIAFIEKCGLTVVYEDLCTGSRFFELNVQGEHGLSDLSRAYLNKWPCARMSDIEERGRNISNAVRDFKVDGVIHHSLKFCDTYLYDAPRLKAMLTSMGLKVCFVEGDCTLGSFGQLKTRIEAFAEILSAGKG